MTDRFFIASVAATLMAACAILALLTAFPARGAEPDGPNTAHDFTFIGIEGTSLPLRSFDGKAMLVVNTASRCGFTDQYADLQALWEQYGPRGLVVLGVPSNDFGGQEPGTESEIKTFCEVNFDVDFPLTAKTAVTGARAHPFYKWAASELGPNAAPRWNFHKYLVAPDGRLVDWFSTGTAPTDSRVTDVVEALLPAGRG